MNRFREQTGISSLARWRLAAAYALAGKPEIARELANELDFNINTYDLMNATFGSSVRDKAMIIESLVTMGQKEKAGTLVIELSKELSSGRWYSTQSTAYALIALCKFAGSSDLTDDELLFEYELQEKGTEEMRTQLPVAQFAIDFEGKDAGHARITNKGSSIIYARLTLEGQPLVGSEISENNKLKIEVQYKSLKGKILDPRKLEQGTDFLAEVRLTNPKIYGYYSNMALTQIFPSGWEIINTRLADYTSVHQGQRPDYLDIRDDRVYTYFGLSETAHYVVMLNAAYQGKFYLPAVNCEAMYDHSIYARKAGMWVEVVQQGETGEKN